MIRVSAVSTNDTEHYNIRPEDRQFISEIRTVYAFTPDSVTHCCEITPSYDLRYLYTFIVYQGEPDDNVRDVLDGRYCYEPTDDMYMWCSAVDRMTPKTCGEFEDLDEACEYLRSNCPI